MKKLVIIASIIIVILVILFVWYNNYPKNYTIEYKIDNNKVTETFNKEKGYYSFVIKGNNNTYVFNIKSEYVAKREMITSVTEEDNCLTIDTNVLSNYTICKKNDEYYTKFYNEKLETKPIEKFEGIDIYELDNSNYLIWNYNHLLSLKKDNYTRISLFNKDIYNLNLYYQLDKYLILPNYDESYTFSSLYMIDSSNLKYSKVYLNIDLYYDSYFLGNYKDDIYLYDDKKETLYRINPYKETIVKNKYEYFDNNKWENTSKKRLSEHSIYFDMTHDFFYEIVNSKLIYHTPDNTINVTSMNVDYLVKSNDTEAYFISGNILYYVNAYNSITKEIGYKEWSYNKGNVFVF